MPTATFHDSISRLGLSLDEAGRQIVQVLSAYQEANAEELLGKETRRLLSLPLSQADIVAHLRRFDATLSAGRAEGGVAILKSLIASVDGDKPVHAASGIYIPAWIEPRPETSPPLQQGYLTGKATDVVRVLELVHDQAAEEERFVDAVTEIFRLTSHTDRARAELRTRELTRELPHCDTRSRLELLVGRYTDNLALVQEVAYEAMKNGPPPHVADRGPAPATGAENLPA